MALSAASANKNSMLLYMVLAIAIALTAWTAMQDGKNDASTKVVEVNKFTRRVHTTSTHNANTTQAVAISSLDLQLLRHVPVKQPAQELFKVHSWFVPPPVKKMPPAPLPAPVAPPLPFTYMGKMEGSPKGTLIFLLANNQLYSVTKGENVNAQWRFDMENENMLSFTYLPLNLAKMLLKSATANTASVNSALAFATRKNQHTE